MQTKRGGDRHRAEQKAEEAKVSGKRGEQMEQGAGQTLEWGCRKQVVGRVDDEPVSLTLAP